MVRMLVLCPVCQGVGRIQRDQLFRAVPATTSWGDCNTNSTAAPGSEPCIYCGGHGTVHHDSVAHGGSG